MVAMREEAMPYQDPDNPERMLYQAKSQPHSVPHALYVRYYQESRADSPHKSDEEARMAALQAAILHVGIEERRKRVPHKVHLVKPGGFEQALFGAVETTGRMPVVRKSQDEEQAR